mgnify:CR=1 FL=1
MTSMSMATPSMRVRPAGLTERLAAHLGLRALRWARRRADMRTREAMIAANACERAVRDREHTWSRLEPIRLR